MLALARGGVVGGPDRSPCVRYRSRRVAARRSTEAVPRDPALLGGAGLARLAVGRGDDALDLELRGQDSLGGPHFQRQAIRLFVGGRPVLGDLDDLPPTLERLGSRHRQP